MNISIDNKSGIVLEPRLHDSTLLGLSFEGKLVLFRFKTADGNIILLLLHGVHGISIESVMETNIVFELRVTAGQQMEPEDFKRISHLSDAGQVDQGRLEQLRSKGLLLVQIDPTLGADALALCENVTWANERAAG